MAQKFAHMVDGVAAEVVSWNPEGRYPADWIWIEAPAEARQGSTFDGETWAHPLGEAIDVARGQPEPEPEPARRTLLTPPEFKMQFTAAERVALRRFREANHADDGLAEAAMIVDDWWQIIDDPRLQYVNLALPQTIEGVHGLVPLGLLSAERADAILAGVEA